MPALSKEESRKFLEDWVKYIECGIQPSQKNRGFVAYEYQGLYGTIENIIAEVYEHEGKTFFEDRTGFRAEITDSSEATAAKVKEQSEGMALFQILEPLSKASLHQQLEKMNRPYSPAWVETIYEGRAGLFNTAMGVFALYHPDDQAEVSQRMEERAVEFIQLQADFLDEDSNWKRHYAALNSLYQDGIRFALGYKEVSGLSAKEEMEVFEIVDVEQKTKDSNLYQSDSNDVITIYSLTHDGQKTMHGDQTELVFRDLGSVWDYLSEFETLQDPKQLLNYSLNVSSSLMDGIEQDVYRLYRGNEIAPINSESGNQNRVLTENDIPSRAKPGSYLVIGEHDPSCTLNGKQFVAALVHDEHTWTTIKRKVVNPAEWLSYSLSERELNVPSQLSSEHEKHLTVEKMKKMKPYSLMSM